MRAENSTLDTIGKAIKMYFEHMEKYSNIRSTASKYSDYLNVKKVLTEFNYSFGHYSFSQINITYVVESFLNNSKHDFNRYAIYKFLIWLYECDLIASKIEI